TGPHKLRESLPLMIFLRNRLKYASAQVTKIVMQRLIKVDGKVRTDPTFPAYMDVVTIEHFRLVYDVKGRFTIHRIPEEAKYKLCKVRKIQLCHKGVPSAITHGRTILYPEPFIKANDTVWDLTTGKITDYRVGTVVNRERHPGSFDIVHIKDTQGHIFATRLCNVFIIGKGNKPYISLPKGKGVKLSIAEERDKRLAAKA
uniref:Small ribosomal subunit protein eS4 n=1 Tax=Megaselia scalaris TaxID=36166 RepID=T1H629_MEGSC